MVGSVGGRNVDSNSGWVLSWSGSRGRDPQHRTLLSAAWFCSKDVFGGNGGGVGAGSW